MQLHVLNSPFSQQQADLLNQLLPTLTDQQKIWLTGYLSAQAALAGSETAALAPTPSAAAPSQPVSKDVTVLYGSQTGNSEGLAKKTAQHLEEKGFQVTLSSMSDFKPNNLKKIHNLLMIVSTHGEGDPPDNALSFHEYVHGRRASKLDHLSFSVLSLGDSSYEFFCQTGKEFDERFKELGGTRLIGRVDCDLDYDEPFSEWLQGVTSALSEGKAAAFPQESAGANNQTAASEYSRTNPFYAEVLENINLNGRGSNKETRHLELSLEGSGLVYEPGDSLGIYPTNDPALVDELLTTCGWNAEEAVTVHKNGDTLLLKEALTSHFEITVLTKPLLQKMADFTKSEALHALLEEGNEEKLKAYIAGRDLVDAARDFGPFEGTAADFTAILRKIPARLYSIASSLKANEEEVHLTIGAVRYDAHGRERQGVCSILCAERLEPGDTLPVYIQHNQNFKLPENPDAPIIMVGPGTGIAPFRSFMQEREEIGANGKSWLFFGDQHFVTDFLYQTEWQKWLKDGVLTKMDVAFSRDSEEKVYVQHQMKKQSKELFEWLEQGAYVYVCGDEKHMAHDVHSTLLSIIEEEGAMSKEKAESYLANLQQQKRYQRDVY
ncbi:assimilatory sulfite reductase (NADPH) flavoprotein subunit [Bacillus pumilus]|uniref:assimilatory sulfite reductase (NADPH) flavoprotein subunit n=1 Tax=Bacillus pumilus TaxID=1408 RepID=UPI00081F99E4|nr:assimilatory sulfite reductase (NADPH) flavoprotein subunit [Bacillus pumilus]AOC56560.1 sulfite reductase [NADPH] flavoprotein, alpha-component [Bacillus pumilus]MBR0585934.1 assimilatory sulfite reductase (NADPH) flavoprotein subunit [Bacillus pumilus DW2J2]MBR0615737.1 assimilatory sulfite reductase (NADPH) flavoprotein subunit [Bacillus pumilus]MBR0623609.1 assimilatory sulfite reductase (NADPH) flavoprotein subunit [Bacillus pumilus]MCY7725173.1 assimilatory sulfite reductase (NADPH) f